MQCLHPHGSHSWPPQPRRPASLYPPRPAPPRPAPTLPCLALAAPTHLQPTMRGKRTLCEVAYTLLWMRRRSAWICRHSAGSRHPQAKRGLQGTAPSPYSSHCSPSRCYSLGEIQHYCSSVAASLRGLQVARSFRSFTVRSASGPAERLDCPRLTASTPPFSGCGSHTSGFSFPVMLHATAAERGRKAVLCSSMAA